MNPSIYAVFFGLVVIFSLLSVVVIKTKIIQVKFSYPGLFTLVVLSLILTIKSGASFKNLGILSPSVKDIMIYGFLTFVCCLGLFLLNKYLYKQEPVTNLFGHTHLKIIFYVLLSSPAQEFLFRSFLFYSLGVISQLNIWSMTLISSLLFGIAHLGYEDKYLTQGTFVIGAIWGLTYYLFPNLILISFSHAIVGLFAFSKGLIKKETFFVQAV